VYNTNVGTEGQSRQGRCQFFSSVAQNKGKNLFAKFDHQTDAVSDYENTFTASEVPATKRSLLPESRKSQWAKEAASK
jgi:hypothetical protein